MKSNEYKYYFEDPQNRETAVTKFLSSFAYAYERLAEYLEISFPVIICTEYRKSHYGRKGDVDFVICKFSEKGNIAPNEIETIAAFEIKASFCNPKGKYHSLKKGKHKKQLKLLKEENWDKISLLDIVVTEPHDNWFHPQMLAIKDSFKKKVAVRGCGHFLIIKNGIKTREEEQSGGLGVIKMVDPTQRKRLGKKIDVKRGFCDYLKAWGINRCDSTYFINDHYIREKMEIGKIISPGVVAPIENEYAV